LVLKKGNLVIDNFSRLSTSANHVLAVVEFPYRSTISLSTPSYGGIKYVDAIRFLSTYSVREVAELPIYEAADTMATALTLDPFFFTVEPEGQWQVIVRPAFSSPPSSIPYHLSVMIDEKTIHCNGFDFAGHILTGEIMPLEMQITDLSQPVETAHQIEALITSPKYSAANVLDRYLDKLPQKPENPAVFKNLGPVDKLYYLLRQIPEAYEMLNQVVSRNVTLSRVWKRVRKRKVPSQRFTAHLDETMVPGSYQIIYKIRGRGSRSGFFERVVMKTAQVTPEPIFDPKNVRAEYMEKKKQLLINYGPKDKYCNLLGPGWKDWLHLDIGKLSATTTDSLNGEYKFVIDDIDLQNLRKAKLTFKFGGKELFSGHVNELLEQRK